MLSSIVKPSSISLILLLFFSFTLLTQSGEIVKVDEICKQAQNPKFCSEILNSGPGGAEGKDLVNLGEYTVDATRKNLSGIIVLLKSLIKNATDPGSKRHFQECYSIYSDEVFGVLDEAKEYLKDGDYGGVSTEGSALMTFSGDCTDDSPGDKSALVKCNADLLNFGDMILLIEGDECSSAVSLNLKLTFSTFALPCLANGQVHDKHLLRIHPAYGFL